MSTEFLELFETRLGANSVCQDRGRDSWAMETQVSLLK